MSDPLQEFIDKTGWKYMDYFDALKNPTDVEILLVSNDYMMEDVHRFTNLKTLICSNLGLKELPENLPKSLMFLDCSQNRIVYITDLPNIVVLKCNQNRIFHIPPLPKCEILECWCTSLKYLPDVPNCKKLIIPISNEIKRWGYLPEKCEIY